MTVTTADVYVNITMKNSSIECKESKERRDDINICIPHNHRFEYWQTSSKEPVNIDSSVSQNFGVIVATSTFNSSSMVSPNDSINTDISRDALKNAVAGAMASIFSRTITAPIERVKLMLQLERVSLTMNSSLPNKSEKVYNYGNKRSVWKVCHQIYTTEGGLRAFWRGNGPNVLLQAGASALSFMFMDCYKNLILQIIDASPSLSSNRSHEATKKGRKILSAFLSGGLAGGTTTTFLYPLAFMRTRLALDVGSSRMYSRGMRDLFQKVWATDGIRGLYQGYGIALTGVIIYRALFLGGYDACKTELLHRRQIRNNSRNDDACDEESRITIGERFAIAQIVSITAGTVCYPIDSVRRRLMMQAGQPMKARLYSNSVDAFQKIIETEGIKGFYLGLGPNIVRSIAGALLLVSYDVFRGGLTNG